MKRPRGFQKGNKAHNRKPLVHGNDDYESLKEMATKYRTSSSLIRYYLKTGKPYCGECIDYKL